MPPAAGQKPPARFALRFGVVYLTLFVLATQLSGSLIPNPWFTYRGLGRLWPMRQITHWVGRTVFGIDVPLDDVSGGETLFFWIQWFWLLAAAIAIAMVWAIAARRDDFGAWRRVFHLAIQLVLAASLIEYGMTKVLLTQFPAPPLTALVTPVGEMTLSALLWTTIGAAPAYQVITGCVETLAGVLLLLPWTVIAGALLGLVSLLQVLLLNLTFDIGVKLVTTHLIVLAVIVLMPSTRQLLRWVGSRGDEFPAAGERVGSRGDEFPAASERVGSRGDEFPAAGEWVGSRGEKFPIAADPTSQRSFSSRRAVAAQIAFGVWLLGVQTWINWSFWEAAGGGRSKSVFYGIWNVESLSVDGETRPAELNDYDRRWRRVIFDDPAQFIVQRIDDSFARYGLTFDSRNGTLALTKGGSRSWRSQLAIDRSDGDHMVLSGEMDAHRIEASLRRVDAAAFPLLNSSFRWIRPHD